MHHAKTPIELGPLSSLPQFDLLFALPGFELGRRETTPLLALRARCCAGNKAGSGASMASDNFAWTVLLLRIHSSPV